MQTPSWQSLLLHPLANGLELGSGTGFVVAQDGAPYRVTNHHVVSGRNPVTGVALHKSCATVDTLRVRHVRDSPTAGMSWEDREVPVVNEAGEALWFEHPEVRRAVR